MTTATRHVRIVRWDPAFLGYYLGYSAASKADFEWALTIVKQLSPGQRRWLPKHNCCWVSDGAVMELMRTFSPLRHYLADQANSCDHQRRQRQDDQQEHW